MTGLKFRTIQTIAALMLWCVTTMVLAATLNDMQISTLENNRVQVCLKFSHPVVAPRSFSIENPAKIILDLPGVKNHLSKALSRTEYNMGNLNKVTVVEGQGKTRIVIDLKESVPFQMEQSGDEIWLILSGGLPPPASAMAEPFREQNYRQANRNFIHQAPFCLSGIDFRRGVQGEGLIIVDLSHASVPIDLKEEENLIKIRFLGTQLPSELQRKLDVIDFGTPVTMINTIQNGTDIEMTINLTGYSENMAYQADKRFTVEVRPLTKDEKEQLKAKTYKYTGEKLSLNFQDIEVRAVLQLIADFTGLNIVTSDSVTGSVTLRLRNVPWDEALDIILRTKGLAQRKIGDVLMIGPAEEMAAREKQDLESTQQVEDLAPLRAEYIEVNYAKASDMAALLKTEKNSLLSSRGTVSVDERTNTLLVQDTLSKLQQVRALVQRLDIPIRQVLIESRVVFVNDDFEDALGVTLSSAAKFRPGQEPVVGFAGNVQGADNIAQGATPASQSLFNRLNVNLPAALPSGIANMAQFGLAIARLPGGTILDLELMALENEGLGKIVASPRLVTSNQQLAYIESGEEIPYQEASSSGATSVAFKKAVLRLEVTPQITPDDHIILDLKVNQDSRGVVTNGVPAINTRQLSTKVLVDNGETIVLGGIYQQNKTRTKLQVPFFGNLPVVGWMFKNETNSDQRNELLIFVTPKIIQDGMAST